MPYSTEKLALANQFLDRRVRLIDCQKAQVRILHDQGTSIHALAKIFKVSRRLIQYTLYPERKRKKDNSKHYEEYRDSGKKAKWTREFRKRKHNILKQLIS